MTGKMSRFFRRNPQSAINRKYAHATVAMQLEGLESRELLSSYYVSTSGSDSAAGTSAAPWRTLQYAANRVVAGDNVNVRAGNYQGFQMTRDGTAAARITFKADPGVNITSPNSSTPDGINLEGADYVTIDGFNVANMPRCGLRSVANTGATFRNNVSDHNGVFGLLTGSSDFTTIENNTFSNSGEQHGIYISGSTATATIRNNRIFGNNLNGIHFNGAQAYRATTRPGSLVEGNIIYNNGRSGGSGINGDGLTGATIRNNLLYNNHASGISLYSIDTVSSAGGGAKNNTIVNNTIVNASDSRWVINIQQNSTGNTLLNNVLYNAGANGSIDISAGSLTGFKSDYNVVMDRFNQSGSRVGLSSWRSATGQDAHSIIATPAQLFANVTGNDYHLSATSPAIDKGTSSTSAPTSDLDGKSRPSGNAFDIGAYEYQSTPTTPPPTTTIPTAPSGLSATAFSSSQVDLKWTDNSSNETGFKIERMAAGGSWTQIATVAAGVTRYYSIGLTPSTNYSYRVRAYNTAGNSAYTGTAAATTLASTPTTGTTYSMWTTSTMPANTTSSDPNQVELGMKFTSSQAGYVTGLRFYKGTGNTGTHTGHLWSSTGQLLASVTFTNETASGWQTAMFSQPVAIAANTTYVISYNAPAGHYAYNSNYFPSTGMTNGPLKAINGVYAYGNNLFPSSTWQNANYWVDVLFKTA